MPDRGVLGLRFTGAYRSHHDFAGVRAHSDLQRRTPFGSQAVGVAAHLVLHPHGRMNRALRMILVRERRAEHRENPVAGGLHDVAVVAAHRVDHQLERGIDDRARLFRIEILLELGRSLDIREQRGDRLALALGDFATMLPGTYSDSRLLVTEGFFGLSGCRE